jgi:hypothetical protein
MKEENDNDKNIINDNKSYKAFNIIKDIQNLLKKESNYKKLCKLNNIIYIYIS